jgi:hypothetical protein
MLLNLLLAEQSVSLCYRHAHCRLDSYYALFCLVCTACLRKRSYRARSSLSLR